MPSLNIKKSPELKKKSLNTKDKSKWFIQVRSVVRWDSYRAYLFQKQSASLQLGATALWEGNIQYFGLH